MRVNYRYFHGKLTSWDVLFQQAAEFADQLPEGSLISISQSCTASAGLVTVWYRRVDEAPREVVDESAVACSM